MTILKLLLDHEADTAIPDTVGYTLLRMAKQKDKTVVVEMVMNHLQQVKERRWKAVVGDDSGRYSKRFAVKSNCRNLGRSSCLRSCINTTF
jgi:hypothetical protein